MPSSTDWGLEYERIPLYQAQLGIVSSAGMTVEPGSLALTDGGILFLQDGLSDDPPSAVWDTSSECGPGLRLEGGTEAIHRRAHLSGTDAFFEHRTQEPSVHKPVYAGDDDESKDPSWKLALQGLFTTTRYPPTVVVFDPAEIAKVPIHSSS